MYADFLQSLKSSYNSDKIHGSSSAPFKQTHLFPSLQMGDSVQWWALVWQMKWGDCFAGCISNLFIPFNPRGLSPSPLTLANSNMSTLQIAAAGMLPALQRSQNRYERAGRPVSRRVNSLIVLIGVIAKSIGLRMSALPRNPSLRILRLENHGDLILIQLVLRSKLKQIDRQGHSL
jgi:hypothetical protein